MKLLIIVLSLFLCSCTSMGSLAIGVASNVVADLVTEEIKKPRKENKQTIRE